MASVHSTSEVNVRSDKTKSLSMSMSISKNKTHSTHTHTLTHTNKKGNLSDSKRKQSTDGSRVSATITSEKFSYLVRPGRKLINIFTYFIRFQDRKRYFGRTTKSQAKDLITGQLTQISMFLRSNSVFIFCLFARLAHLCLYLC